MAKQDQNVFYLSNITLGWIFQTFEFWIQFLLFFDTFKVRIKNKYKFCGNVLLLL